MLRNILILLGCVYIIGTFVEVANLKRSVQLLENNLAECTYYHNKALEELEKYKNKHDS